MQTFKLGAILLSLLSGILLGQASNFVPAVDAKHEPKSAASAAVLAVNLSPLAALEAPVMEADLACLECLNEPVGMDLDLSALNALEPLEPTPDPISKGTEKPIEKPAVKPVPSPVPPAPAVQPVKPVQPVQAVPIRPVVQTQACPGGQCYQVTPQVISQPAPRRGLGKLLFRNK